MVAEKRRPRDELPRFERDNRRERAAPARAEADNLRLRSELSHSLRHNRRFRRTRLRFETANRKVGDPLPDLEADNSTIASDVPRDHVAPLRHWARILFERVAKAVSLRGGESPRWCMHDELFSLLRDLNGVRQSPRYHPEGDALFHSLQVFDLARRATTDRVLWAAALFHDVGKAVDGPLHDEVGADLLTGLLCPRAVWLVRHHLDLLKDARGARRRFRGVPAMRELELVRRWDVGGRNPRARTLSLEEAWDHLFTGDAVFLDPDDAGDAAFDPFAVES
jgi:hypothetical protein